MDAIVFLREKINKLYETNATVHIGITLTRPKKHTEVQEAKIVGVYTNIFRIMSQGKYYTFQYADILTNTITLSELS